MQLFLKILSEIANSAGSVQMAPLRAVWCVFTLFAYGILSETLMYEILWDLAYVENFLLNELLENIDSLEDWIHLMEFRSFCMDDNCTPSPVRKEVRAQLFKASLA